MTARAWIIVQTGPDQGTRHELDADEVPIGRAPPTGIRIADTKMSRHHATFVRDGETWRVRDPGSRNGTRVNGRAARDEPLRHMDTVSFGSTHVRFLSPSTDPGQTPAPGEPEGQTAGPAPSEPEGRVEGFVDDRPTVSESLDSTQMTLLRRRARDPAPDASPEETRRAHDRLVELLDFSRHAAAAASTQDLLALATSRLRDLLAADRVVPILLEPDGTPRPWFPPGGIAAERRPVSRGIVSHVLANRLAVLCVRPESDERFADRPSLAGGEVRTAIAAPLLRGERLRGALYADRMAPGEPFNRAELELLLAFAVVTSDALVSQETLDRMSRQVALGDAGPLRIVGTGEAMRRVLQFVDRAAPTDAPVLLTGETGTGKEMIARAIHAASPRARGPFEAVACGAIPPDLLEGELFGHVRGAFTGAVADRPGRFEAADGGTLFLDEAGDLPPASQAALLRAIEQHRIRRVGDTRERIVDVRIVSATRRDLAQAARAGEFREDLLYRLNVLSITLPPLRDRPEDLPALTDHFLRLLSAQLGRPAPTVDDAARARLARYPWPGNVRELRNILERALVQTPRTVLRAADLPESLGESPAPGAVPPPPLPDSWRLEDLERWHLERTLDAAAGNKVRAAQMLGIDRSTLYAKMKRYGIGPA